MKIEKKICKSHIIYLKKVTTQIKMRQKMNYTQLILGKENQIRLDKAEQLINSAIDILNEVE